MKPLELDERDVRQGFLEVSGANPVRQMMAMIETTRAFEANTRMIQNQDSVTGTLISRVLQQLKYRSATCTTNLQAIDLRD